MDIKELLQRIHALIEEYLEIGSMATFDDLKRHNDNLQAEKDRLQDKYNELLDRIDSYESACDNAVTILNECIEGRV